MKYWSENMTQDFIIFCTEGFGAGVDAPNVRTVVVVGGSRSLFYFWQVASREGRDGAGCTVHICITLAIWLQLVLLIDMIWHARLIDMGNFNDGQRWDVQNVGVWSCKYILVARGFTPARKEEKRMGLRVHYAVTCVWTKKMREKILLWIFINKLAFCRKELLKFEREKRIGISRRIQMQKI